ncbi:DUF4998 domain-containing protein [Sphingobacterium sp. HJSM2_6]|uniref:DUF4998 domain-containing protein n=1 Tax=Sphingobacterium sp. HJSM2_6 TaxID=3366264 RepID=UPI003BC18DCE
MNDSFIEFVKPGGITYVERAKLVKTYSGFNRIKFVWPAPVDPNVTKAHIYWNNFSDSVKIDISSDLDSVKYFLDIPEGTYSFTIRTYDDAGNRSVPVEVQGRSIGESFLSNMFNRPLVRAYVDNTDGRLELNWGGADIHNGSVGHLLRYTTVSGAEKKLFIKPETSVSLLTDYKNGTDLIYDTWYLADTTSVDTLKTELTSFSSEAIRYKLDKSKFREYVLPTDAIARADIGWHLRNAWDGSRNPDPGYHSYNVIKPAQVTIDLGTPDYGLYSFRLWQRTDWGSSYSHGNPKNFTLWGSNEPSSDGSYVGWTKLGDFTSNSHVLADGELFIIPPGAPASKYLRIQVASTWGYGTAADPIVIMEIELMGNFIGAN